MKDADELRDYNFRIRLNPFERKQLRELADFDGNGNMSDYVRSLINERWESLNHEK